MLEVTLSQSKENRNFYRVDFSYNKSFVDFLKTYPIEKRKFDVTRKYWLINIYTLFEILLKFKSSEKIIFTFKSPEDKLIFFKKAKQLYNKEMLKLEKIKLNDKRIEHLLYVKENIDIYVDKIKHRVSEILNPEFTLFKFQYEGLAFICEAGSALLSLDMGLGKTIQAILYGELMNYKKILVLTPKSLKYNFYNEILKFTNSKGYFINSKKNKYSYSESRYVIINYDYFRSKTFNKDKLKEININDFDCLIADEAHRLNNKKSNTFKNINKIFKSIENRLFLSGTPTPNRLSELFTLLQLINPLSFSNKEKFYIDYCGMEMEFNGFGHNYVLTDPTKVDEFYDKTLAFTFRKRKVDVLKDLPDKIIQPIYLELSSSEYSEYISIMDGFDPNDIGFNIDLDDNYLAKFTKARKYLSMKKIEYINEIIEDLLYSGNKIVFIDYYLDTLFKMNNLFKNESSLFYGKLTDIQRDELVKLFQDENSGLKIFLGQETATKEGLTLTASSNMIINTIPQSYGVFDQITGRCHRIGQLNSVNIKIPVFKNTIDSKMYNNLLSKAKEIHKGLDNLNIKDLNIK